MIDQTELIKYFLLESEEYINTLIEGLEDLENKGFSQETLESIYRAIHTLKGSASIVKFNKIATLAHKLEDLFDSIINNEIQQDISIINIARRVVNSIITLINEVSTYNEEKSELDSNLVNLIDEIVEKKVILQIEEAQDTYVSLPMTNAVRVELSVIDSLFDILSEIIVQKNVINDREKELKYLVEEILKSGKKLFSEIVSFSDRYWLSPLSDKTKVIDTFFTDFSDLEFDRYDEYHIFTRKIAEITNDINESLNELISFSEHLSANFKTLGREINTLKDNLLSIRMLPIGRLLNKISEAIKDTANNLGKQINFEIKGGDIKIDKPVLDLLYEPIIHILRNAIDHGIETPEQRLAIGKPEKGNIKLNVKKEGKYVVISITDDGKGIDIEKVKEIAINKNLLSQEQILYMNNEEILSYIFVPGFSTSEDVDFQSGRGMGLNIVKTAIAKLKGTIEVFSEIRKQTTFTIKIPQSLSITNLLIFKSSELEFAVPINYIEEILIIDDFPEVKSERLINHKNRFIPVKIFSELYFSSNGKQSEKGYIIIFNFSGIRKALLVDNILGQEEAAIYPLGKFLEGLTQYIGYVLSGQGTPRLVIDPLKIFEEEFIFTISKPLTLESVPYTGTVLIVDDSISVRKSLQTLLETKNIRVYTAKNGAEALSILEDKNVDIVITDLEMPVMHGYELINKLRKDIRFKDLTIIVLTSRGTRKHQEKAIDLGADGFLIKPFDEKTITELLRNFPILKNQIY
ncbi:MAG: response regulator [Thermodesulfovibrio sp.]|nr:response regulator [Thermodesulfovibrio sp.]